jgi:hypothetical protein
MAQGTIPFTGQMQNSQKTEAAWAAIRPTLDTAESRLLLTAKIFQNLEGKGLNEQKAAAANWLRGAGLTGWADKVMSASDTAGVHTAVWNSVQEALSSLKAINANTGGRILNSEFEQYVDHGLSPDLPAASLHSATSQLLGAVYQMRNMISDYNAVGSQAGWKDANKFQSAYMDANPLPGFVKYAADSIGPFKGMETASPAATTAAPQYREGMTASNAKGDQIIFRNGQWVPVPKPTYGAGQTMPVPR